MRGSLLVGTSGFAYEEWRGPFYPPDLRPRDMLRFYAERFRTVELNYTFRRMPSERAVRGWAAEVDEGFRFAVKANQRITHLRRLRDTEAALPEFLELVRPLGPRLGPILFQCPPTLEADLGLLASFLDALPPGHRYAMEFRHPSWEAARGLLGERRVAWCAADTDEEPLRPDAAAWTPFGYLRLRKLEYSDDDLRAWAGEITAALDDGRDVHVYLKHEEKATGPRFARRLLELLGEAQPNRDARTWKQGQ